MTGGFAALAAKVCKHNANDAKCLELGCLCTPIAAKTLGVRGYRDHAYLMKVLCQRWRKMELSMYLQFQQAFQRINMKTCV